MNKKEKNKLNKITIMVVIIMLFNFVMPNYSHAGFLSSIGHALLDAFSDLLLTISDLLFEELQKIFVSKDPINKGGTYSIKYSPGTIFSGEIPAFDINFINVEFDNDKNEEQEEPIESQEPEEPEEPEPPESQEPEEPEPPEPTYDPVYEEYLENEHGIIQEGPQEAQEAQEKLTSMVGNLKPIISSWYNILRNVALVALLSILVYIAIRVIISSAARDKAKYKKMLGNWLAALCMVFILHFMMSLVFTLTRSYFRCAWKICGWS